MTTKLEKTVVAWKREQDKEGYTSAVSDLLQHGCASGIVGNMIYYSDTVKFYKRHQAEINAMLAELCMDTGETPASLFARSGWDETDPLARDVTNQNLLAWFGFEETARRLYDEE